MVQVDLPDYGYVNARVRAMFARLLPKETVLSMTEEKDVDSLVSTLERTPYGTYVAQAFLKDPLVPDIGWALQQSFIADMNRIDESTGGDPHRLFNLLLSRWDVDNIKTILRGKKSYIANTEVLETLIPIGTLDMVTMEDVVRSAGVREVVDTMATLRVVYAEPLTLSLAAYFESGEDLAILELALDRYYFEHTMDQLGSGFNAGLVRSMLVAEIDTRNINTLMRIQEVELTEDQISLLYIPGGTLDEKAFLELGSMRDVMGVARSYPDKKMREMLERACERHPELGCVAIEVELERDLITKGAAMRNVDMLSIGVIIGYMWVKYNEVINLRIILHGIMLGHSGETMREQLFFVLDRKGKAA